ncbi:hypothetical protein IJM16_01900 [Candidatus Saccharibacteria bacterium]|nr:hypothetical protein [Candidatus Saccharibacteria bacterium]
MGVMKYRMNIEEYKIPISRTMKISFLDGKTRAKGGRNNIKLICRLAKTAGVRGVARAKLTDAIMAICNNDTLIDGMIPKYLEVYRDRLIIRLEKYDPDRLGYGNDNMYDLANNWICIPFEDTEGAVEVFDDEGEWYGVAWIGNLTKIRELRRLQSIGRTIVPDYNCSKFSQKSLGMCTIREEYPICSEFERI